MGYGNGRPSLTQRMAAKAIFQELLKTRTQRELATELGIDQSRVSAGKSTGRVHTAVIEKAARLVKMPEEDIRQLMEVEESGLTFSARLHEREGQLIYNDNNQRQVSVIGAKEKADLRDVVAAQAAFSALCPPQARFDDAVVLNVIRQMSQVRAYLEAVHTAARLRDILADGDAEDLEPPK